MPIATIRLYTPGDWSGQLICWRLESTFCHATIELQGNIYSATYPKIKKMTEGDPEASIPPRGGIEKNLYLSKDQEAAALAYCESMVGSQYDVISALGWAFRIQAMQRKRHVYCFELVYDALAAAGLFPTSKRLVTGDQLLVDLYETGHITSPSVTPVRAYTQKPAVKVKSP